MDKLKFMALRNALIGILLIIGINLAVLFSLGFPLMAIIQIKKYLPLLILLILGFGFQIWLFTYLKHKTAVGCTTTVASGGISSVSMILCCSHYLVNILPFIGVTAFASLSRYTFWFLMIGVISNLIGISIMLYKIKRYRKNG